MKTRRDFIKISTAGAGATAIGLNTLKWVGKIQAAGNEELDEREFKRYPTYCEVCFWKCAGWTYTDSSGKITKVIGNDEDPHCNGRLCPRGTGGTGMYWDEDRLKKPLIRVEGKEGQTFREASWEEALDLVASKMKEVKAKYGPESFALFNHGSAGEHFGHLFKAYGSRNIAAPSFAQCRGPREVGFETTYGFAVGSPEPTDIRDTRCLVLIGSHIGENMHNSQVQEMSDAIDNGATIITVDPRFSTAASKSKYWLPIKPATDIALLMAWAHVLIYDELYDKDYVSQYGYGFENLKEHVRNMTPEWAYGITTIKPHIIRQTAREMADASPSVIVHPGRHVTWYGDDTQRSRAIAILNGLLGAWGRRGGFYFKESMAVPEYPCPEYPEVDWDWKETLQGRYPLARLAVANAIIDASLKPMESGRQIKAWMVAGTNMPMTLPNKNATIKAMQEIDFVCVVDTMPMEVTAYADVILPECTYLERYDELRHSPNREPNIALRMPAAQPRWDTKPASWMARELGIRLGLEDYFPWKDYTEVLDWQLKQLGSSLEEMKVKGLIKYPRTSGPLYLGKGEAYNFPTNTGKIEFYSTELAAEGFEPMPVYKPHEEPPQKYYRLIHGRAPMHTFSRTSNNQNLFDLMSENHVWVNPRVARLWNLEKGQKIWLKNQDGVVTDFPIKVRITERIRWDSVYIVHGFGHAIKTLSRAYGRGASDAELITNVNIDPIMGGTGMRNNFVTFLTENPVNKEVES